MWQHIRQIDTPPHTHTQLHHTPNTRTLTHQIACTHALALCSLSYMGIYPRDLVRFTPFTHRATFYRLSSATTWANQCRDRWHVTQLAMQWYGHMRKRSCPHCCATGRSNMPAPQQATWSVCTLLSDVKLAEKPLWGAGMRA